jgi:hypothetical protein
MPPTDREEARRACCRQSECSRSRSGLPLAPRRDTRPPTAHRRQIADTPGTPSTGWTVQDVSVGPAPASSAAPSASPVCVVGVVDYAPGPTVNEEEPHVERAAVSRNVRHTPLRFCPWSRRRRYSAPTVAHRQPMTDTPSPVPGTAGRATQVDGAPASRIAPGPDAGSS